METPIVVAIITGGLLLLGSVFAYFSTRGKTQMDYRSQSEKRIDDKINAHMDSLEERIEDLKAENTERKIVQQAQGIELERLKKAQAESTRREVVLYRYTVALRTHILSELPPPPPAPPVELMDWMENFEDTLPPAGSA